MVVSQKDSQLNFLMAWTPNNSWYTSIFGDMGVVPSIPNQIYRWTTNASLDLH